MIHSEFKGSHYEAGFAYAKNLASQGIYMKEVHRLVMNEEKHQFAQDCAVICKHVYPEVMEEMQGIADGQGMALHELTDFLFCMYAYTADVFCTCFAFGKDGKHIFGRNSDFLIALEPFYDSPYYHLDEGYAFIGNTTAMVQIEDGFNACGLAVGLTFVLPTVRKPGLHAGLLVRYLLEKCRNVEEAIHALHHLPIATAQTLTLVDRKGVMAVIECNAEQIVVIEPEESAHFVVATNDFQHPRMQRYHYPMEDTIGSKARYQTAQQALSKENCYSLRYAMDILAGKFGFMCQYDRSLGMDTVWSSVYDLTNQKIYRVEGNPRCVAFEEDTRMIFLNSQE